MSPSSRRAPTRSPRGSCAITGARRMRAARPAGHRAARATTPILRKWAAKKGFEQLRVDGELVPTAPWPRLTASSSTPSSCPWPSRRRVGNEAALRAALTRALDFGKGAACTSLAAAASRVDGVFHQARLPRLRQELRGARSAPILLQLQARLVRGLLRHRGRAGRTSMRSRRGEEIVVERAGVRGAEALRRLRRAAPEPDGAAACASAGAPSPRSPRCRSPAQRRVLQAAASGRARQQIARDLVAEIRSRLEFPERVGLGYLQLDRSAPTLSRRRGAAHPARRAARLEPAAGCCYVLDEPTIGLHPRDNARAARHARRACAPRATRSSWSSTTRRPSAAPSTSSISGPAPACTAARWWPRAPSATSCATRARSPGASCAQPCCIRAAAARGPRVRATRRDRSIAGARAAQPARISMCAFPLGGSRCVTGV